MPEVVSEEQRLVFSFSELSQVAKTLLKIGKDQSIWVLNGSLGAGKTTLVKALLAEQGINETVTSPTFSIVNEYGNAKQSSIYHFDFYRIKNETEAFDIGTDEYFDSKHWCLIEWADRIPSLLPSNYFEIHLEIIDEQTRLIRYRDHA